MFLDVHWFGFSFVDFDGWLLLLLAFDWCCRWIGIIWITFKCCWLILNDSAWLRLMLRDVPWSWLIPTDADWFWLILIDVGWFLLQLIDFDCFQLMMVDSKSCAWLHLALLVCPWFWLMLIDLDWFEVMPNDNGSFRLNLIDLDRIELTVTDCDWFIFVCINSDWNEIAFEWFWSLLIDFKTTWLIVIESVLFGFDAFVYVCIFIDCDCFWLMLMNFNGWSSMLFNHDFIIIDCYTISIYLKWCCLFKNDYDRRCFTFCNLNANDVDWFWLLMFEVDCSLCLIDLNCLCLVLMDVD